MELGWKYSKKCSILLTKIRTDLRKTSQSWARWRKWPQWNNVKKWDSGNSKKRLHPQPISNFGDIFRFRFSLSDRRTRRIDQVLGEHALCDEFLEMGMLVPATALMALMALSSAAIWTASPWSSCSSPCGVGFAYRHIQCRSASNNQLLPNSQCSDVKPSTTKSCSMPDCQWGCAPLLSDAICLTASLQQVLFFSLCLVLKIVN
jgi:hypothetical protein